MFFKRSKKKSQECNHEEDMLLKRIALEASPEICIKAELESILRDSGNELEYFHLVYTDMFMDGSLPEGKNTVFLLKSQHSGELYSLELKKH